MIKPSDNEPIVQLPDKQRGAITELSKPTDAWEFLDTLHANNLAIVPGSLRWIAHPDDPRRLIPAVEVRIKTQADIA
jgi:hypothetical protein